MRIQDIRRTINFGTLKGFQTSLNFGTVKGFQTSLNFGTVKGFQTSLNFGTVKGLQTAMVVVALVAMSSCRGACNRGGDAERALTPQGRLAPFPAAARMVAGVDVAQLRASPAAAK